MAVMVTVPRDQNKLSSPVPPKNGNASAGSRADLWNATAERVPVFRDFPLRLLLRRSTGAH